MSWALSPRDSLNVTSVSPFPQIYTKVQKVACPRTQSWCVLKEGPTCELDEEEHTRHPVLKAISSWRSTWA